MEVFFQSLIVKLPLYEQPLKIPEMGAETKRITTKMAAILGI